MQIKDFKKLSPNLEVFAAHKPVRQTDADVFGSLFDAACYEVAETRSLGPREVRQRAYDRERSDSFDTERRHPIEPTNQRADNISIENDTCSDRRCEHDSLEPSHKLEEERANKSDLPVESAGPEGAADKRIENNKATAAENDDSVEVPVNSENNPPGQVANDQMMLNNLAEQAGAVLVRDDKGNVVNTDSAQSNISETADQQNAALRIQQAFDNKNTWQGGQGRNQSNNSESVFPNNGGKAVSDELKPAPTGDNEPQHGDVKNSDNAKVLALTADESDSRAIKEQNAADKLVATKNPVTNGNDKNVVEPSSLDALARSLQAEKNEAGRSGATDVQAQNASQTLTSVPTDNANMSNGSFAGRGNKNNNNPLEALTRGGMRVGLEKPANIQDIISSQKPAAVEAHDMRQNIDRIVKAARTIVNRRSSVMQLRLDPPELGTLRVEIRHSADGLNLQLQATNPKAQQLLQQHSSELRSALEAQGFQTTRIDVQLRLDLGNDQQTLSQDQGQDQGQDNLQDHSQGQQDREDQRNFQEQFQEMEFTNLDVKV